MDAELHKLWQRVNEMKPLEEQIDKLGQDIADLDEGIRKVAIEATKIANALERTQMSYGTLLTWMAQSANSPIRVDEAKKLIDLMQKGMEKK